MEVVVTTVDIRCAKLQSNRHHQQTNTVFTGRMPFLSPSQQSQSTEGKDTEDDCSAVNCLSLSVFLSAG